MRRWFVPELPACTALKKRKYEDVIVVDSPCVLCRIAKYDTSEKGSGTIATAIRMKQVGYATLKGFEGARLLVQLQLATEEVVEFGSPKSFISFTSEGSGNE